MPFPVAASRLERLENHTKYNLFVRCSSCLSKTHMKLKIIFRPNLSIKLSLNAYIFVQFKNLSIGTIILLCTLKSIKIPTTFFLFLIFLHHLQVSNK